MFHVFSPFSAYFSPHDIIYSGKIKGLLSGEFHFCSLPSVPQKRMKENLAYIILFLQDIMR